MAVVIWEQVLTKSPLLVALAIAGGCLAMVWPFSRKTQLAEEQADRIRRRCGIAAGTLQHCLAANPEHRDRCSSLETQVVHCYAEVACPEAAAAHQRCFQRVVNSQGGEPYNACEQQVAAMRKCLRRYGLYPIVSGSSGSVAARGGGRRGS